MCYQSLNEGTCSKVRCHFTHIQGTKKTTKNVEENQPERDPRNTDTKENTRKEVGNFLAKLEIQEKLDHFQAQMEQIVHQLAIPHTQIAREAQAPPSGKSVSTTNTPNTATRPPTSMAKTTTSPVVYTKANQLLQKFLLSNIQGPYPVNNQSKLKYITVMAQEGNHVLMAFTETHLSLEIEDEEIKIQNYTTFHTDRKNRSNGGVVLYIRNDITSNVEVLDSLPLRRHH